MQLIIGFEPQYDLQQAVADYISWLRDGNLVL